MLRIFLTYKAKYLLVLTITMFMVCSCSKEDEFEVEKEWDEENKVELIERNKECHILIIGNSLARDAFCYVPAIIEEICPNVLVDMQIMYVSGKPLRTHWNYIVNESKKFVWDQYFTDVGRWTSISGADASQIISSLSWDLVILQEGSVNARSYETTQPYVSKIIDYIRPFQAHTAFAYVIIPSLPDGATSLGGVSSDDIWMKNVETAQQLLGKEVDYLIPCGTAIQNARKTSLANYGYWGLLTFDGRHLQEGIPCLVDAYAATESILKILSFETSIENSTIHISQKWVSSINVLGQHGPVLEGSDSDYELAKRCALNAIEFPYVITVQ